VSRSKYHLILTLSTVQSLERSEIMKSFRELRVWQKAIDLVEAIYLRTQKFPREETYGLTSQIRRAVVSIASNIAEGHTREHIKEYLHHLSMAQASLAELETQLEIAARLKYIPRAQLSALLDESSALGKQRYALRDALLRV
jgi:four helix bundle protein